MLMKLGFASFVLFIAVYLTAFLIPVWDLAASAWQGIDHVLPIEIVGCSMMFVIATNIGWGILAGIVSNRRGWVMGVSPAGSLSNAIGLIAINLCFTAFAMLFAACQRERYGRYFPAPHECR